MCAEPPGVRTERRWFQFTLGMLLGLTAATSALLAMWTWRGAFGALQFCLGAAVCLTALGVWRRRIGLIATGLLLAASMIYALFYSARNTTITAGTAQGFVFLPVTVVDAVTGEPVPQATVRLPGTNYEPDRCRTGGAGTARLAFDAQYTVTRSESILFSRDQQLINTRRKTLEVEAAGYEPVSKPLSQYLGRVCNLRDDELPPITVELVRKPREEETPRP